MLVELVRETSGFFGLVYVALRSPDLSARRIARRVRAGGHDVPREKLAERWNRSLEILPWFAGRASRFWAYDNSDGTLDGGPPVLLAEGREGRVQIYEPDAIPALTEVLRPLV